MILGSSSPSELALVTPLIIITAQIMETSPSGITHLPGVMGVEKEFVAELVDSFYKSLEGCLSLVLKGSTTPFRS